MCAGVPQGAGVQAQLQVGSCRTWPGWTTILRAALFILPGAIVEPWKRPAAKRFTLPAQRQGLGTGLQTRWALWLPFYIWTAVVATLFQVLSIRLLHALSPGVQDASLIFHPLHRFGPWRTLKQHLGPFALCKHCPLATSRADARLCQRLPTDHLGGRQVTHARG